MEKTLLKEINKNIVKLSKREYYSDIEFVSRKTEIKSTFETPLGIDEAEIGFRALYTYYSIPNVSKDNNIFQFKYMNDDYKITLPEGAYEIEQITEYIQKYIKSEFFYGNSIAKDPNNNNGDEDTPEITIRPVEATGHSVIEISANCKVDFSVENSIGSLLGFSKVKGGNPNILEAGIHYSDELVDIVPVNSISICVKVNDLDVHGSVVNGAVTNRIYTFFPDVQPGEKINEVIENKILYPIERVSKIQTISVSLIDQNGKLINNRGEDITLILTLKYTLG